MKKKDIRLIAFLLIFSLTAILVVGCGSKPKTQDPAGPGSPAAPQQKYTLSVILGGTTGVYYTHGAALSEVVGRNSEFLTLIPSTSGGGTENLRNVQGKKHDIGIAPLADVINAWNATDMFSNEPKASDLRFLGPAEDPIGLQIVTLKRSHITLPEDLAGKKVVLGAPGSTARTMAEYILGEIGILDKIIVTDYGQEELPTRLQDGDIDAFGLMGNVPVPRVDGIAAVEPVIIVDLTDAMARTNFLSKYPFVEFPVKAGSYKGHDDDTMTFGTLPVWFTNKDVPDEAIYEFMEQSYSEKGIKDLETTFKDHDHDRKDPLDVLPIPLHPAAERYWKERGVTIPQPSQVK